MKATKKLVAAAISLAAAVSLTVGSTFAWFSYQSSVSIGAVNFSVDSSDENLQVAAVAVGETPALSDFTYSLSSEKVIEAIGGKDSVAYSPLTVAEDEADNTVSATNPISLITKDNSEASKKSYAAFDLVFRYTPYKTLDGNPSTVMPSLILNVGSVITADPLSASDTTYVAWDGYQWNDYATTEDGIAKNKNDPLNVRARDAARVAFLFADGVTTKNKIWAPSEAIDAGIQDNTSDTAKGYYLGNLASDYNNYHNNIKAVSSPVYASRVYAAKTDNFQNSAITEFPAVQGANSYSELRLTVKVWLEGKDGDCLESVNKDSFKFILKFRTSTVSA